MSKLSGPLGDAIPPDAEVSPELIAALTSQQLSAEDIEIVTDADGKSIIRLKHEVKFETRPWHQKKIFSGVYCGGCIKRNKVKIECFEVDRISQGILIAHIALQKFADETSPSSSVSATTMEQAATMSGRSMQNEGSLVKNLITFSF